MTKRQQDIIRNTITIIIIVILMVGEGTSIYIGYKIHNYWFLTCVTFIWLKMIREVFFEKRISNTVLNNKYPHTTMAGIRIIMSITFILSWVSFISFLLYIIISYYYIEFGKMKQLKREV